MVEPKNRPSDAYGDTELPGWQPKEKAAPTATEKRNSRNSVGGISAQEGRGPKDPSVQGEGTHEPWRCGATVFCRLSRQLLVPITQRPQQELDKLRLEEGKPPREAAVEPEPERQEELRVDPSAKKDKRLKSENTKSESLGSNSKAAREHARSQLQTGYPPQAETVQGYCTVWERVTWYQVSSTHGTFSTAWWSFQLCSPQNEPQAPSISSALVLVPPPLRLRELSQKPLPRACSVLTGRALALAC